MQRNANSDRRGGRHMELGSRLQEIREDQGVTQTELAARVRTSQSTISQIEAGDRNPSYRMLVKLAAALGVTVGYVLGEDSVGDLDPAAEAHFRQYRGLSDDARRQLTEYARFLRERQADKARHEEP